MLITLFGQFEMTRLASGRYIIYIN